MINNLILDICYHPKIYIKNNKVHSFEVLARFKDESGSYYDTESVINSIENIEDARKLTTRVINKVFEHFKFFSKIPKVCINISVNEIEDNGFRNWLNNIFVGNEIFIKNIEFEITEKNSVENEVIFIENLRFLKDKGFAISIDDLGKGYNKIDVIYKYPVDFIKLDKSFLNKQSKNYTKLQSVIKEIHSLNKIVTIEGVESLEDFKLIKNLECDFAQGYYFYKPISYKRVDFITY